MALLTGPDVHAMEEKIRHTVYARTCVDAGHRAISVVICTGCQEAYCTECKPAGSCCKKA